jgi:hypothetical protein
MEIFRVGLGRKALMVLIAHTVPLSPPPQVLPADMAVPTMFVEIKIKVSRPKVGQTQSESGKGVPWELSGHMETAHVSP